MEGLRPDIALVGANNERLEIYDYTRRLMRALGNPLVVMPTHWDGYGYAPLREQSLAAAHEFADEVTAASPKPESLFHSISSRSGCHDAESGELN